MDRALKTYGRRGGRPLSARQKDLITNQLPKLRVPVGAPAMLTPGDILPDATSFWLEIGFGGGEHVSGQAARHPEIGILASEVFIEGVAKLLGQITDLQLSNVRVWDKDGRDLVSALEDACIERIFILFPDPWPKTRHQKRRLIQAEFLSDLARILVPGGRLRFATDVRSYADAALLELLAHPDFEWIADSADDWRLAPADHIPTRYQTKHLGDIEPVFYEFRRRYA